MKEASFDEEQFIPHFTDRIIEWLDSGRMSPWLFYLLLFVSVGVVFTLLSWLLMIKPPGVIAPIYFLLGTWFVEMLFINHVLVRAARGALEDFRPMIEHEQERYDGLLFQFTHIPSKAVNRWFVIGILAGIGVATYAWQNLDLVEDVPLLFGNVTAAVGFSLFFVAVYRVVHQLGIVRSLLRDIPKINLYDLSAVYSLSLFPVKVIVINALFLWVNPALIFFPGMFEDPVLLVLWFVLTLLPAFVIYLAMQEIRGRLVSEKEGLLRENGRLLDDAAKNANNYMEAQDYPSIEQLERGVNTLLAFRREIESVSTYPWRPETIRWLATVLFLPLAIWIVQFLIQRVLTR